MLLYLCFVITLNLAIGYALGAYLGPLPVGGFALRRERLDSEPLVRPVEPASSADESPAAPDTASFPPSEPLRNKLPEVTETEVLSGLDAFQQQLAALAEGLESSQDDEEAFGEQASRVQEANHAYLETAQDQMDKLDPASEARKTVSAGVEQVDKASKEFDALLGEGLTDEASRRSLVDKTTELNEKVGEAKEELTTQVKAIKQQRDAATGLATLDGLIAQIEGVLSEAGNEHVRTAALIRSDPPEAGSDQELYPVIQEKLIEMVGQRLSETSQAAKLDDGQVLLLMEREELGAITEQIDSLRREIAETTFFQGDKQVQTTVSCAVVDLPGAKTRDDVLQRLEAAMSETTRHGVNHTFYHDGSFASVVEPSTSSVESSRVELAV